MVSEVPTICFAHAAYRLGDAYRGRVRNGAIVEVRDLDALRDAVTTAEVLVVSGLWRNELAALAPRLRFIQSISAGTDQFSRATLAEHGIRLASAQGVNEQAVAEHAMALLLSLTRHLFRARDDQHEGRWRGMIGDPGARQEELAGKTMLVVGLGRIGTKVARLGQAFGMRVIGSRRTPRREGDAVDEIVPPDRLVEALSRADSVVLTCPLTPETKGLIGPRELAAMKPTAYLVNVARGGVLDEPALLDALRAERLRGVALDCTAEEPLPSSSPLWTMPNVIVTPHSAGETSRYEERVIDLLVENLARLRRGDPLVNGIT